MPAASSPQGWLVVQFGTQTPRRCRRADHQSVSADPAQVRPACADEVSPGSGVPIPCPSETAIVAQPKGGQDGHDARQEPWRPLSAVWER